LRQNLRNYFLGQSLVRRGQPWPFGQWGHGVYGKYEYYAELLGTNDHAVIRLYVEYLTKKHIKTHWNCPCGSGKQLRACHIQQLQDLRAKIPRSVARQTLVYFALLEQWRKKASADVPSAGT
jgi:SEC-C motif